jgi:hypothetical protein
MPNYIDQLLAQSGGYVESPQQAIDYNTVRNPYGDWQKNYAKTNTGAAYTPDSKITQTKEQFLKKYASAIGKDGKFIPGGANLWFDNEDAGTVYDTMIGRQAGAVRHMGNPRDGWDVTDPDTFNSEVNMNWVDDPRPGGGWASVKDVVLPGIATLAAIYGGQALLGAVGGGATAAGGGFSATGSALPSLGTLGTAAPSLTGGAVGAGDLALTAMPEVTAASMGMTGAQAAGMGTAGAAAGNGLLSAPTMAMPNAVTAADLSMTAMPQVTAASMGAGEAAAGAGAAGGLLGNGGAGVSTAIDGSAGMSGAQAAQAATGATIGNGAMGGMSTPITGSGLLQTGSTLGNIADAVGGVKNIGSVVGGLLGAASAKDTTTSSSKDPWAPAQPYLLENLKQNAALQKQYMDNPFSDKQKQYFQNMDTDINNFRTNINPQMQAFAQQAMTGPGYQRQAQAMPQFQTGRPDWLKGLLGG